MHRRPEFSFPGSSPARGLPPRPPAQPTAQRHGQDEEELRWLQASLQASPDYSSGTPSPQLWAAHHHRHPEHHRLYPASAGSSPSRAQAIAGYRREMLDLVRGLPESAYELSLRDIVERPPPAPLASPPPSSVPTPPPQPSGSDAPAAAARADAKDAAVAAADAQGGGGSNKARRQGRKQRAMRKQRSRSLERSVSLDTGLLIKLFLPLSIAAKKKVSPKPDDAKKKDKDSKKKDKKKQGKKKKEAAAAPAPAQDEEWWAKSESSDAGASSRTSSTGSSSNSSAASIRNVNGGGANQRAPARSWSRKRTGCYAFFRPNKGRNGVTQE